MKKFLLYFILPIAIIYAAIQFIAIPKAINNIQSYFSSVGFKNAIIDKAVFSFNGLSIDNITLDKDGFNVAHNIRAKIFWPSYFINSHIQSINVRKLKISSVANTPKDILVYKNALRINNLAAYNINIEKIIWDIATPKKAIRIDGSMNLTQENDTKKIKGKLNATQHEFSVNSLWSGTVNADGSYNIDGLYDSLSINSKIITLNRGTGFISFNHENKKTNVTSQLDAGNGTLIGIPVKNVNLLISQDKESYPILLRAKASGIEDVNLYGDFNFSSEIKNQALDLSLKVKNTSDFISYLKQQNLIKEPSDNSHYTTQSTNFYLKYISENRFADGPFPFDLKIEQSQKEILEGTFLIYPDTLDIRGSAQGKRNAISLLQSLFQIPNKNISEDSIRFDSNIKTVL